MKGKPVLFGDRVHLVPLDRLGLSTVCQMRNLADSMEGSYQFWPYSETEQERWFDDYVKDPSQRRFVIRNDSNPVGFIGLTNINHKEGGAELGIRIIPEYKRRGYATEAVRILSDWAFAEARMHRLCSEVFYMNEASIKLFQKVGWRLWGTKHEAHWQGGRWLDVLCYELCISEAISIPSWYPDLVNVPCVVTATDVPFTLTGAVEIIPIDLDAEALRSIPTGIFLDPVTSTYQPKPTGRPEGQNPPSGGSNVRPPNKGTTSEHLILDPVVDK